MHQDRFTVALQIVIELNHEVIVPSAYITIFAYCNMMNMIQKPELSAA